jgi:nitric oxide reductase NorQ protein
MSTAALRQHAPFAAGDASGHSDNVVALEPSGAFVNSPVIQTITDRALAYLRSGYAVHFCGPAGTGKTTLAVHVAAQLGRPTVLLHGDHEFGSSDLVGRENGYHRSRVVDNYIASVVKLEEHSRPLWVDNRITTACRDGHVIIYDEFNRSRPEANNPFLSILSEGMLNIPGQNGGYVRVHPAFRAIFTSNPAEYAGVHRTQDALLDRLISLALGHYDRDTEIAIAMRRSGCAPGVAERVVDLVRLARVEGPDSNHPTIRAAIAISRVLTGCRAEARAGDAVFMWACRDVLGRYAGEDAAAYAAIDRLIGRVCGVGHRANRRAAADPAAS